MSSVLLPPVRQPVKRLYGIQGVGFIFLKNQGYPDCNGGRNPSERHPCEAACLEDCGNALSGDRGTGARRGNPGPRLREYGPRPCACNAQEKLWWMGDRHLPCEAMIRQSACRAIGSWQAAGYILGAVRCTKIWHTVASTARRQDGSMLPYTAGWRRGSFVPDGFCAVCVRGS